MIGHAFESAAVRDGADTLLALVRDDGTATHAHAFSKALAEGPEAARNVADIVHLLCLLHGRQPGVVDHAAANPGASAFQPFLAAAAEAFAAERALLTKLVVAVGPLPSTPGQSETETTVLAQHHAIAMLANSERTGCATGAALAVMIDWWAIRTVLDTAARRLSIEAAPCALPDLATIAQALRGTLTTVPASRAMLFGAEQIVAQHRGLWDLLETRAAARSDY